MEVLRDASPITDTYGNLVIEFISYTLDEAHPKYPVEECKERDVNYAAPLKVNVRLTNKQTGEVKQADIFMGDFPLMTETGTFVINGAERVIVSQIIRSPGMYYAFEIDKARFSIRITEPYTEERKALARAKMIEINKKEEVV